MRPLVQAVDSATGKIVGAVELILLPYPAKPSPAKPYLFNLCVDPSYRRRGIGQKLVVIVPPALVVAVLGGTRGACSCSGVAVNAPYLRITRA